MKCEHCMRLIGPVVKGCRLYWHLVWISYDPVRDTATDTTQSRHQFTTVIEPDSVHQWIVKLICVSCNHTHFKSQRPFQYPYNVNSTFENDRDPRHPAMQSICLLMCCVKNEVMLISILKKAQCTYLSKDCFKSFS